MDLPEQLRQQIEARAAAYPAAQLSQAARGLSERYRNSTGQGKRLLQGEREALAYAIARMPATYGAVCRSLELALPCPHGNLCPMAEEDWCHFTVRVTRSRLHRLCKGGEAPFEDEKFTFLAVCRSEARPAEARILRHPQKAAGHIGLTLCGAQGIGNCTVTKKQGAAFKQARKAEAGEAFFLPVRPER